MVNTHMRTVDMGDETAVGHYKRYIALSDDQKTNYDNDLRNLAKMLGKIPTIEFDNEAHNIEVKYGITL